MVNQSKKYENVSDIKSCEEVADLVCDTIYNFLSGYTAKGKEERYQKDFCDFFGKKDQNFSDDNFETFRYQLDYLYDMIEDQEFAMSMDPIKRFKMLQLVYAAKENYNLKIKEGVIQHIEVNSNGHSSYVMYEPLKSFDDFEGSVGDFCQSNPNSSGLYITPIFQNNKFSLAVVNIEDGQFKKNDMKIYALGDEIGCIITINDLITSQDMTLSSNMFFRNFSNFQKENTQRDSFDDDAISTESDSSSSDESQKENTQRDSSNDGPVIELLTSSSDESQDIPYTQHDVPNHDSTQHNGFEFDNDPFNTPPPQFGNFPPISNIPSYNSGPQNMPLYHQGPQNMPSYGYSQNPVGHDSSNGFSSYFYDTSNRENSFSHNMYDVSYLHDNASDAGFREVLQKTVRNNVNNLIWTQYIHYKLSKEEFANKIGDKTVMPNEVIEFEEIYDYYNKYKVSLEVNDVKILQTLCGLEQEVNFGTDNEGYTYMTKKNNSDEDIYVCTTPVSYDDNKFKIILQNFLKTHQNFSGIFAVTCDYDVGDKWSLTTCKIQNGQIIDTFTPFPHDGDCNQGLWAMRCLKSLLLDNSYESYKQSRDNQNEYLNKVQPIINEVNELIEEQRRMQHTPEFVPSYSNMPPLPQFNNEFNQYQPNLPYDQDPQNQYRYNSNFALYDTPNNMSPFYVCNGFDRNGYQLDSKSGHIEDVKYYFQSCRRNFCADNLPFGDNTFKLLYDSCIEFHASIKTEERQDFENSWYYFNIGNDSFVNKLKYLENERMLNLYDIRLLQLYYAEGVKNNRQARVTYHYNPLENNTKEEYLIQCNSLITEIHKDNEDLSYFMMPVMWGGFDRDSTQFQNIEAMTKFLPSHLVQDGIYLIPTNSGQHWELTCVKKQGDSLEYFVTQIPAWYNNCGVNTTKAMQYVIENGYEAAKKHYNKRSQDILVFDERIDVENTNYILYQEEPLEPHYAPDFDRDQSWDNRYMGFSNTYAPQRPIFRGITEHSYFDTFNNFLENETWKNDYFSFENVELNEIFEKYKGKKIVFGIDFVNKFNEVCNSNGGKIVLQYQEEQIKETIDLNHIGTYVENHNYDELKEEEKKLTRFLFHCKIAEIIKKARDRYGSERIPDIELNYIFNSGEKCNIQTGQFSSGFSIKWFDEKFSKMVKDILCTNVGAIQKSLSHNYFQNKDNLTISVDGIDQEITSDSTEEDIRKMYFDIAFNGKPFTCTVLGKQRNFDRLLLGETLVDSVVESFKSAHLVTGFDALSADIEKKHGKITYKVEEEELGKEDFLSALYDQIPCTMSYYVNGKERIIQHDTRTGWQKAIEIMQADAKADGLEAYKQQIQSSAILQQVKTNNAGKFGGNGDFSCEIVLANDDCTNKNLSTILPNCLEEDGSVNFKFKVHGREYELEPREWSHGLKAKELSKRYEQQIASYYIASSIFNSGVDKIKIGKEEIGIDKTNGSDNYRTVRQRLYTALQNKQDIELFIGEKQSTISTKSNVIRRTDSALTEVRLEEKELQDKVNAFRDMVLGEYDNNLKCFNQGGINFYFIDENGKNCTKDIHDKGQNLRAQDLCNCKIREKQFDEKENTLYDIDFYNNVLSGRIDIIKKDIEYAYERFYLLYSLGRYQSKGQEDDTESKYTYKFLKDGIEQTKHDDDTETQLIYKDKSGEEITYTLLAFNNPERYDIDRIAEIIPEFKVATQDVQVFNDMNIDQMDGNNKVYIKVNGEQKDDCYIAGLVTNEKLNTLQEKFNFLTTGDRLSHYQPIRLHYKGEEYICSHNFLDNGNQYITRDNFQKNFDNFATILDMQEQGFIQVQYSDGSLCNNQDLYKAICYKKDVDEEENKTVQIVYGDKTIDLKPDEGYEIISGQLRGLKEQQEKDVEELKKALGEAGLELKTTALDRQLRIEDKTSEQAYFFYNSRNYLAINEKENPYAKLLNAGNNIIIEKFIDYTTTELIKEEVTINSLPTFKECLNTIVQNELKDTLDKYTEYVQKVNDTFGFEDALDLTSTEKHTITLCGNQTIEYDATDVKTIREAQKKVERAPHPLLAQGISGGFLENSLIVDDTGCVKIKPKNCTEEYQLFTRQGGRDQLVQDVALKGKSTEEILDAICQKYSIDLDTQIYAKNEDDIATVAIPLYASAARAGDKDRFFDSFYQSFEKLELYNRLKKIRADGDESKMEIRHDDYGHMTLINSVNQLTNIFKSQEIVSVKCQYGESNEEFTHNLGTSYDNPLNNHTFDDVDRYIRNTIDSKPSEDAKEVLSQIAYDTVSHQTTINGREIQFLNVSSNNEGRDVLRVIELVEDSGKRGYLDYKKLHKKVKSFKNTDRLQALYKASNGSYILSDNIDFEDDSLKKFVGKATFFDEFVKLNRDEGIGYEIKNAADNSLIAFSNNVATMFRDLKDKTCKIKMTKDGDSEEIEVQFDTKDHISEAIDKLKDTADYLLNPIGLDMLNTFDSSKKKKHKKRKKTKDDSVDIEDTTVIKDEEIEESKKEKRKKEEKYDPFKDTENNPELRKLVESFIEQSDPDMSAAIKENSLITMFNSSSVIEDFRKSAKYNKDYLTNSSNAMDTMGDIQQLDDVLKKEGDFYDKCDYYQNLGIKLADVNVHELQLLTIEEYLRKHDTKKVKYFKSDKTNGPSYVYLEDQKLLISLSSDGYSDDFVGQNKELQELIKNNGVTKLSSKQKDGDWVLDCYLDKDKDHLIVDPKVDGRQVDATSGGVWAAKTTNEIIELGIQNFQFLNAYRQEFLEYPEFLNGKTAEDLNRIKLSIKTFAKCKEEEQTYEKFSEIVNSVKDKSTSDVLSELKYISLDDVTRSNSKEEAKKREEEEKQKETEKQHRIDENVAQITKQENNKKFFGTTIAGSLLLGVAVGGPIGIALGICTSVVSVVFRNIFKDAKKALKAKKEDYKKKQETSTENEDKLLLEHEVHNTQPRKELAGLMTQNIDLNTNNAIIDSAKTKNKEKNHEV